MKSRRPFTKPSAAPIERLEPRIAPATFTVTTNADAGPGSLRQALLDANGTPNTGAADLVIFAIGGPSKIIHPLSPLPVITEAIVIDGYTQSGASFNTLATGSNAQLLIEIDGSQSPGDGLVIAGEGNSRIQGLSIHGFAVGDPGTGNAIKLLSGNNLIQGNFLGLDILGVGASDAGNQGSAVMIGDGTGGPASVAGNLIGGKDDPGFRNVIGDNQYGVFVSTEGSFTTIENNLIGVGLDGFATRSNLYGIFDLQADHTLIGDGTAAGRNVVSGNTFTGIILSGSKNAEIQGNYVGTNADGSSDLANLSGIALNNGATGILISLNVISGNVVDGLVIGAAADTPISNVTVQANIIGLNAGVNETVPNGGNGIVIDGENSGIVIGGLGAGDGNQIAGNNLAGIKEATHSHGTRFYGNLIFNNGGLDIDLATHFEDYFGVSKIDSTNDPTEFTAAPALTTFDNSGSSVTLDGAYAGLPNTSYRIELFGAAPSQLNLSGHGGSGIYLGFVTVTTDSLGFANFHYQDNLALPTDSIFNATATPVFDPGGTSEFGSAVGPHGIFTWTGANGSDWYDAGNWSPNGVPGPLDEADLTSGSTPIDLGGFAVVRTFEHFANNLTGSGSLVVLDVLYWNGGQHDGVHLILNDDAAGLVGGAAPLVLKNASFDNRGSINLTGLMQMDNSVLQNVTAGSSIDFAATISSSDPVGSPSSVINMGRINASGTGNYGFTNIPVVNYGTLDLESGTFIADSVSQYSGFLFVQNGDLLVPNGLFVNDGQLQGGGTIFGDVAVTGGTVQPDGTLTISGNYAQSGGVLQVRIKGPAISTDYDVLEITGNASLSGGLQYLLDPGYTPGANDHFNILTSAALSGTYDVVPPSSGLSVNYDARDIVLALQLAHTFHWDAGAGADTSWFNPLNWDADSGFPQAGDTAILDIDATISLDASDATVGSFFLSAGTLTGNAQLTITDLFHWSGGTMSGSGKTIVDTDAFATLDGGETKQLVTRTFLNGGQLDWLDSGSLSLDGATLINQGSFFVENDAAITKSTGLGPTIENTGTFNKTGGTGTTRIDSGILFTNFGDLSVHSGTLELPDLFSQTSGSTLLYGATLASPSIVNINGGILGGVGTILGSVSNHGTVQPGPADDGGTLNIAGDFTQDATGELSIRFYSATGDFTNLAISGVTTLGGTLDVTYFPTSYPASGSLFKIISAGSVSGVFQNTFVGAPMNVQYLSDGVQLQAFAASNDFTLVEGGHSFTFLDADNHAVKVSLSGHGHVFVYLVGGVTDHADIASLLLSGTDLGTKLTVAMVNKKDPGVTVAEITTADPNQHMGTIALGSNLVLGNGTDDGIADLRVSGKLNALVLGDVRAHTLVQLGEDLPYDVADKSVPDTKNNFPTLTIHDILGDGVEIEVIDNGIPGGSDGSLGGGGLGNVLIHSWAYAGFIRTTQSIGNFTVQSGNFFGVLEVDKFHHGASTEADVGAMTIADGSWGSSGTEIEGDVKSFSAEAFLAGASITAGTMGTIKMTQGAFDGTLILTDPDSPSVPVFTVNTDFTGRVVSAQSIKKLNIKGDFTGSLSAPSIGSITAFAFLGTTGLTQIEATLGGLGTIKSTAGIVRDYDLITPLAFGGIAVKLGKLSATTVGIDNVHVTAASIGNISVSLSAAKGSTGVNLTGIRDSSFTTTANGTTRGQVGALGNMAITLAGGAGADGTGILGAVFDARVEADEFGANAASTVNSLGKLSVKVTGFGGTSLGVQNSRFEGDTIGAVKVSVSKGIGGTAFGLYGASFIADGAIGALAFDGDVSDNLVTELLVNAGGKIGAVSLKARTATLGSLVDSSILAGQALQLTGTDKELKAKLANAALGAVKLTGALRTSTLAAGGSIGAVSANEMADSQVIAGAMLGADSALGGGDDTFQRAAAIASIVVKGAFARTSLVAGIATSNATYGDADDTVAPAAGTLPTSSSIGAITLALASSPTPAADTALDHHYAIQAVALKSLKTVAGLTKDFTVPAFLETGGANEDADDILLRLR